MLINQVLFISGLKFTAAAHSALVVTFGPLFTLLFPGSEARKSSEQKYCGMALSICGIFLNLDKNLNIQTASLMGHLLTLAGSGAFAYYTVISKHVAAKYGAFSATAFTYFAGACVFLPVGLPALVTLHVAAVALGRTRGILLRGCYPAYHSGSADLLLCSSIPCRLRGWRP